MKEVRSRAARLPTCDLVIERVALGEPLGALADHVATCDGCRRLTAMPGQLATAAERPDPGLGFTARMTVAARHRLAVRRRRRIAGTAAAAVAACAVGVFALTRSPASSEDRSTAAVETPAPTVDDKPIAIGDTELAGLVRLADTHRARRISAPWGRIQRPLAPYIQLVKGVAP